MLTTTTLLIYIAFGTATAYFAAKFKKNPYLWFFIGIFFGVCGLIILFFLNYKKKKSFEKKSFEKNIPPLISTKFWYYLNPENQSLGPFSINKLQNLFSEDKISKKTYVWNEDLKDWKLLKDIKEFSIFEKSKITS